MGKRHSGVSVVVVREVRVSRPTVARMMTCWVSVVVAWEPRAVTVCVTVVEQRVVTVACGTVVIVLCVVVGESLGEVLGGKMTGGPGSETVKVKVLTSVTEADR